MSAPWRWCVDVAGAEPPEACDWFVDLPLRGGFVRLLVSGARSSTPLGFLPERGARVTAQPHGAGARWLAEARALVEE